MLSYILYSIAENIFNNPPLKGDIGGCSLLLCDNINNLIYNQKNLLKTDK